MRQQDDLSKRDHGGNLDAAMRTYGGRLEQWADLSTGINPVPYPVPQISADAWAALPRKSDMQHLLGIAAKAYNTKASLAAFAGAQGAIQAMGFIQQAGNARVLSPTYNEHAAALRTCGWSVTEVTLLEELYGAGLAVVVNPNNPDGACYAPETLRELARKVGLLVVDESFVDVQEELSLAPVLDQLKNVIVLRSFGKFYGLAGVRLGFALGDEALIERLRDLSGPWPVSGPAVEIACVALADRVWKARTIERLTRDAKHLDALALKAGWSFVGGAALFRTYETPDAALAKKTLAQQRIWSRIFPYNTRWIRLGLARDAAQWKVLEIALGASRP
ncbi:threonine-phosphate decarboxylase CobD [Lentibacter sp. XHP0401]|uniref:threonine-phosphate decarboxylase CobD n=1 Tax=Lentibacter sp. XHP0401 TaxID=2984334 RepID=UPI0021E822B2|nr:threonine-phosphate decarboxylase CobD [Lentibacter sp. XHP0401]MCV2892065.1 threonine-phosphate decarboxylase CobD [Lentibacter sp. XHP0401]